VGLGVAIDVRDALELGIGLAAELEDRLEFARLVFVAPGRFDRGQRNTADALHLAAVHRELDVGGALVAVHHLQLGAGKFLARLLAAVHPGLASAGPLVPYPHLRLAAVRFLTACANVPSGPVAPVAPKTASLRKRSSKVAIPETFVTPHSPLLSSMLPIQASF